jgi:hypothetical protein
MDHWAFSIVVVLVALGSIIVVALGPLLAGFRNPRPADQPAEMRRDVPAPSSDDPGMVG